jgi:hypothetical protein
VLGQLSMHVAVGKGASVRGQRGRRHRGRANTENAKQHELRTPSPHTDDNESARAKLRLSLVRAHVAFDAAVGH